MLFFSKATTGFSCQDRPARWAIGFCNAESHVTLSRARETLQTLSLPLISYGIVRLHMLLGMRSISYLAALLNFTCLVLRHRPYHMLHTQQITSRDCFTNNRVIAISNDPPDHAISLSNSSLFHQQHSSILLPNDKPLKAL